MTDVPVIVYLGPSMSLSDAQQIITADYRPPIKRGDLAGVAPYTITAIIDGVFEQELSVSPREVQDAVARGVVVFGGSSMGALRAAEVPGVIGIGRVFQWYRDEVITRDDEVALLFDPHSGRSLTVPIVNVRFAVERLCSLGTIDLEVGSSLLSAALKIPYKERTYRLILECAGLANRSDSQDLIAMLQVHDLKYQDARAVLQAIDSHLQRRNKTFGKDIAVTQASGLSFNTTLEEYRPIDRQVLIWESGDCATHEEIYDFLGFTGKLETHARAVLAGFAVEPDLVDLDQCRITNADAQAVLESAARRWGWMSSEEAKVTFADLGLDQQWVSHQCAKEAVSQKLALQLVREATFAFRQALQTELFLNDLTLKRETMRFGSLRFFAQQSKMPPKPEELREAQTVLCKVNRQFHLSSLRQRWTQIGLSDRATQDAFVEQLARARQAGRELVQAMTGRHPPVATPAEACLAGFALRPCPKPEGESRFCLPITTAEEHARRIGKIIGVTRVGMIGELANLTGVQIAQAARPGNAWSSSYGSGKSRTKEGAIVGSIMEETEKWAQEQFHPDEATIVGSFRDLRDQGRFIDPATLDLPYDSPYHDEMPLHWYRCFDLLSRQELYLPVDPLQISQRKHDIYFTQRGTRKHLATNGLGSGFSREEAVLHGVCEYVERHAQRLAELFLVNPGGIGDHPYRFVDLSTASATVRDLAAHLSFHQATVRVLNITSEIQIPTFVATITRDLQRADGYSTHPDPNTAIEIALLEAAQTIASATAGGREDLSIRARSLGRHERPRPISLEDAWFWLDPDPVYEPVNEIQGLLSTDIYEDLNWCLEQIRMAGVEHVLVVDLTQPEIEPAHVVRVIVPGLETNNPFFTGPRARLVLLRDLLPKWR